MKSLQNDFLKRSVAALESLTERAKNEAVLPPEFVREAFRTLHTIKGTSQTFGFSASANLAHELENLLSDAKENDEFLNGNFKAELLNGLAYLIDSFTQTDNFSNQKSFLEKNNRSNKTTAKLQNSVAFESEIFKQFSEHEKKSILSEVNKGKNTFFVNADFGLADFANGFKNLREILSAKGEIIATFPNQQTAEKDKIGFQICFASEETAENLREILKDFSAEIIEQELLLQNNLDEVLLQIAAYGNELATYFDKEIAIEISAEKITLSPEKSKLIFDVLLHLLRNAIDHAIEDKEERTAKGKNRPAKIEISVKLVENGLKLSVKDDGKGIDLEKVKAIAIEKRLLSDEKILTESEMLDLIFLHEFSTAETVTKVSGRGIGLDAVKNLVENSGGTISVKSRRSLGTTFEVFFRNEQ